MGQLVPLYALGVRVLHRADPDVERRAGVGGEDSAAEEEGPLRLHRGGHRAATPGRALQGGGQGAGVQVPERVVHALEPGGMFVLARMGVFIANELLIEERVLSHFIT
jgi:hypothetical protein